MKIAARVRARLLAICGLTVVLVAVSGCQNYRDQLRRGQGYYEDTRYELALSVFRHLEPDQDSLEKPDQVRYFYLRGMTDFRLGYEADARYWLSLAKASSQRASGALAEDEQKRMNDALAELDAKVYGTAPKDDAAPEAIELGTKCQWSSECEQGFVCKDEVCVQAD